MTLDHSKEEIAKRICNFLPPPVLPGSGYKSVISAP